MKTLPEFQAFFEKELRPKLLSVQAERDVTRPRFWRMWRWWLLGTVVLTATLMILITTQRLPPGPLSTAPLPIAWALTLIVVPIVLSVRISRWAGKTEGMEKSLTVVPAVRFLAPEFTYAASAHVPVAKVRASRLFELQGQWTGMHGDDCFTGKIGETAVTFSEVTVTTARRVQRNRKVETLRSTDTGLFLAADFPRPFRHATLVLPDFREKVLGAALEGAIGGAIDFINEMEVLVKDATGQRRPRGHAPTPGEAGWDPLRMDDAAFERMFKVYCTDAEEARAILTPDLMARLTAFKERMRHRLSLSFIGTSMHAFIASGSLFEGDVDQDVTQFAAYQTYFEQIYVVFDLVEVMQANPALWNKA